MKFTGNKIRDFQEAYFLDFGIKLNEDEAKKLSSELLMFVELVARKSVEDSDQPP